MRQFQSGQKTLTTIALVKLLDSPVSGESATHLITSLRKMQLSKKQIKKFRQLGRVRSHALKIHKQLVQNGNDVIDFPLQKEAEELHLFMLGYVPARQFREYVNELRSSLNKPDYLLGWPGINWISES